MIKEGVFLGTRYSAVSVPEVWQMYIKEKTIS